MFVRETLRGNTEFCVKFEIDFVNEIDEGYAFCEKNGWLGHKEFCERWGWTQVDKIDCLIYFMKVIFYYFSTYVCVCFFFTASNTAFLYKYLTVTENLKN